MGFLNRMKQQLNATKAEVRQEFVDEVLTGSETISYGQFREIVENPFNMNQSTLERLNSDYDVLKEIQPFGRPGVFIVHNHTKNIYYVGNAMNLQEEISEHFNISRAIGKGRDGISPIVNDYMDRHPMEIKMLCLMNTEEKVAEFLTLVTHKLKSEGKNVSIVEHNSEYL